MGHTYRIEKKYSNGAFLNAMMKYQRDYWNSLTTLSGCIEKLTEQERQNSATEWLTTFEKKYGKAYIRKNRGAIVAALSATHSMNSEACCGANWKEALSKEAFFYHACKMYLSEFLVFYDSLNEKDRAMVESRKEFVTALQNDMAHGYISVMYDALSMLRPDLEEYRAKNESQEIFQLIKSQPALQQPFDIDKVFERLIAITSE